MNRVLYMLLFLFAESSIASSVLTEQVITHKNVRKLGFSIAIEVTPEATSINLVGPKSINGNCFIGRSGNALMDKDGNEVAVYTTQLQGSVVAPVASGYYTSNEITMSIWMDYFCPPGEGSKSRRFIVPSVAKYIITSLGTGQ